MSLNFLSPKAYRSYNENEGNNEEKNEVSVETLDLSELDKDNSSSEYREVRPFYWIVIGVAFVVSWYMSERIAASVSQIGSSYKIKVPGGLGLFKYMITQNFAAFLFCTILAGVLSWFTFYQLTKPKEKEEDRDMKFAKIDVVGSTRWMDAREMSERFNLCPVDKLDGLPIGVRDGKAICIPWKPKSDKYSLPNNNILVCGAPGTRKSVGFALPHCSEYLKKGHSLIVTDTKGDLYRKLAPVAERYGYKIKKFICQAERFRYSDGWDCIKNIRESQDPLSAASIFADVVITNTEDPKGQSPLFWRNLDGNLLEALVLYVALSKHFVPMTNRSEPKRDLKEVYAILSSNFEIVERIFENIKILDNKDLSLAAYERWHTNAQAEQGFSNLATRLRAFQNDFITGMLSADDIDIKAAGKEKCIYFIIMDDQVSTYSFISSLFFSFAFYELVQLADAGDQVLKVPVQFMLDEFANCGTIPDFTRKISTVRSRGIGITIIIQGLNQLKLLYPNNEWENILNGCATQIVLGAYENTTAKYYSDMIGDCTVEVENQARNFATFSLSRFFGLSRDVKITKNVQRRRLLNPEEIRGMDIDRQIAVFAGSTRVLEERKYNFYTMHPASKIVSDIKHTEGIPQWVIDDGLVDVREYDAGSEPVLVDNETGEIYESGLSGIISQAKKDRKEEQEIEEYSISGINDFEHDDNSFTYSDEINESITENYLFDELTDDDDELL